MRNPIVNHENHTIEVTKTFYNSSSRVGTYEYDILVSVRREYPKYKLVIKSPAKSSAKKIKIERDFMKMYITSFNENYEEGLDELNELFNNTSIKEDEIIAWFIETYPKYTEISKANLTIKYMYKMRDIEKKNKEGNAA